MNFYKMLKKKDASYKVKLSISIKIWNVFHFNLFKKNSKNFIDDQISEILKLIKTSEEDEWIMNDIFDFRYYDRNKRLQYKIKWHDFDRNDDWYNIDKNEFDIVVDVTINFHQQYLHKSKFVNNAEMIFTINSFQKNNATSKVFLRRFNRQRRFINHSKTLIYKD